MLLEGQVLRGRAKGKAMTEGPGRDSSLYRSGIMIDEGKSSVHEGNT